MSERSPFVVVGRIAGVYGVQGWMRLISHTSPRENILRYRDWFIRAGDGWQRLPGFEGRLHGKGLVVKLDAVGDRDQARAYIGAEIAVPRSELPPTAPGEYYWADLQNLRVRTVDGVEFGTVDYLFETGANDVLVVKGERERLVPFITGEVIREVDLDQGLITVDWDPEF